MKHNLTKGMICKATKYCYHGDNLGNKAVTLEIDGALYTIWRHGVKGGLNYNALKLAMLEDQKGLEKAIKHAINFAYLDVK